MIAVNILCLVLSSFLLGLFPVGDSMWWIVLFVFALNAFIVYDDIYRGHRI